jgi:hypothetical protein
MSLKTLGQVNPRESLLIFDHFQIDHDLPKFEQERKEAKAQNGDEATLYITPAGTNFIRYNDSTNVTVHHGMVEFSTHPKKRSWWRRWFTRTPKPISVKYVFEQVLSNPEELVIFNERAAALQALTDNARAAGQKSLLAQMQAEREVRQFENALFARGQKRYLSETQLLKFVRGCEKGLCLDWIQSFIRPIPPSVVAAKIKCDDLGLFDNYVVLHYDPENRGTTKADREKAKDPVLFGVMRGSRKLYFVDDWVDEHCDLTFQQIVDKLGSKEQTEIK